jgi:hypothetical protein
VKEAASWYVCWGEALAWVYQTSWELQIVSMTRENSGLYSFDSNFFVGGGGIENFRNLEGGIENLPIASTGAL